MSGAEWTIVAYAISLTLVLGYAALLGFAGLSAGRREKKSRAGR